jgi:hypothetical protein
MVGVIRPPSESRAADVTMTSAFGAAELLVGALVALALAAGVRLVAAVFPDEAGALLRVGVFCPAVDVATAGWAADGVFFTTVARLRFVPERGRVDRVDVSSAIASLLWYPLAIVHPVDPTVAANPVNGSLTEGEMGVDCPRRR